MAAFLFVGCPLYVFCIVDQLGVGWLSESVSDKLQDGFLLLGCQLDRLPVWHTLTDAIFLGVKEWLRSCDRCENFVLNELPVHADNLSISCNGFAEQLPDECQNVLDIDIWQVIGFDIFAAISHSYDVHFVINEEIRQARNYLNSKVLK
jgi:hypothetical protein